MRSKTKMLHRLPRILRSPQQQRITTRRRPQRQLIHRQALSSSLLNSCAGCGREVESGDREFRDGQEACVIGYGADYDKGALGWCHFLAGAAAGEHDEAGEGHWGAVDAGHKEATKDDFVES